MVTSGWETIETCEATTSETVAPARSAMLRCVATGMTRSSVPITAQLGIDVHAAASVGAMFAPSAMGRWLAAISQRSASGRSWAKDSCTADGLRNASTSPSGAPGYPVRSRTVVGSGTASAEPESPRMSKTLSPISGMNALT